MLMILTISKIAWSTVPTSVSCTEGLVVTIIVVVDDVVAGMVVVVATVANTVLIPQTKVPQAKAPQR